MRAADECCCVVSHAREGIYLQSEKYIGTFVGEKTKTREVQLRAHEARSNERGCAGA